MSRSRWQIGGLPCASLSAECQRDNNARQRPPQNRLHIWWARRPPTISRAAILAALWPHDFHIRPEHLPTRIPAPDPSDIEALPGKLEPHRAFFEGLIGDVKPTELAPQHDAFLRAMGVLGDPQADYLRIAAAQEYKVGTKPIQMPTAWGYRHSPAFTVLPTSELLADALDQTRGLLGVSDGLPVRVLDFMAGGGAIPLEALRYGFEVFSNDLNPVASLVQRATLTYPARHGAGITPSFRSLGDELADVVGKRLSPFFFHQEGPKWFSECRDLVSNHFSAAAVVRREPAGAESIQATLWSRTVSCTRCALEIPISTNFHIVTKKGQPARAIAAFPEVPAMGRGNTCTFRIVRKSEWVDCTWPKPGFENWHPRNTPTFKDGKAMCPRCGNVVDGSEVKAQGQAREGGLPAQMYAVVSKVPVKLTYRNGDTKIRQMWRFRAPTTEDLDAVAAAERELRRLLPRWEAEGLVPDEEIPEGDKTREPLNVGFNRWRDLFLPRQLLTNLVVLEEIRAAQERVRKAHPADEAEAIAVYLAFILSKVVNYNSVNTFWHYGRQTVAQTFSRHDFAFRPAFCEFEGSRETVLWGAAQVADAYESIAALIHGGSATLGDDDDDDDGSEDVDDDDDIAADEDQEDEDVDESEGDSPDATGAESVAHLRSEVIVPTVTNQDAAALSVPGPGSVHLICVDPPYYNNVQYAELSNFFYVWLKRALRGWPGLAHLFTEPLAETNREAVANNARWQRDAEREQAAWQIRYDSAYERIYGERVAGAGGRPKKRYTQKAARELAIEEVGPKPPSAKDRADAFYEDKMASVFRRAKRLLHPSGRMVVMFNHKQTWAWRSLGMALIRAGFEVRSSIPIHTEAESSLNIRGLDAARSTVLLLCMPREEREQAPGNWGTVQARVERIARAAAERFQSQGLQGTDLYLSALGPALGEVGRNWPVTDFAGRDIDLVDALDVAYKSVGQWRLTQLLSELTASAEFHEAAQSFAADAVDRDTQTLWLWLDTFQGETADSDDVRKLAKSLGVNPDDFKAMGLLDKDKALFILRAPQDTDLRLVSRRLKGDVVTRGRAAREADAWEERVFPNFMGAAVWNALSLMTGTSEGPRGTDALRRWLRESGYGSQREFVGAYAVTLHLLERVFERRREDDHWAEARHQARRGWDLLLKTWKV